MARAAGRGVADDHEVLPPPAFQLDPAFRAARNVDRLCLLAHQPFETELARVFEHLLHLAREILAVAHGRILIPFQRLFQSLPAFAQRQPAQIQAVEKRGIAHEIDALRVLAFVERALQRLEAGASVVAQHDNFAVEPGVVEFPFLQGLDQPRQLRRPVLPRAREQPHLAAGQTRQQAIAVVLDLVDPVAVHRRRADQCGELRRDEPGEPAFRRARGRRRLALHALRRFQRDLGLVPAARVLVAPLDEQPLLVPHTGKRPRAVQLLAFEPETQSTLPQRRFRIAVPGDPQAAIPQQHFSGAILLLGNHAFELAVLERMVLGLHGKTLFARVEARPLRRRRAPGGSRNAAGGRHAAECRTPGVFSLIRPPVPAAQGCERNRAFPGIAPDAWRWSPKERSRGLPPWADTLLLLLFPL